jgi:sortase B
MTAYYKRPLVRGKVYESQKSATSSFFIEWVEPAKLSHKLIITLCGLIVFTALSAYNWLSVAPFGLSKLGLLTSLDTIADTFAFSTMSEAQIKIVEIVLIVSAAMLGLSILLVLTSMGCCKLKARVPLAITGFSFGVASPLVFIVMAFAINGTLAIPAFETERLLPGFFALLAAAISLCYCGKYPYLTAIRDRRNSLGTRVVTTFVPVKGDGTWEGIRKTIFTGAVICFIYFGVPSAVMLVNDFVEEQAQKDRSDRVGREIDPNHNVWEIFRNKPADPLEKYLDLFYENKDMIGYIKLGDTRIDYPVLQTDNNHYYLHYAFDRSRNTSGAVFADFRNRFDPMNPFDLSDNTVLYGHNVRSGSFFAPLSNYWTTTNGWKSSDLSFYKTNPVIQFDTMYQELKWKVFGVVLFNTQDRFGETIDYWRTHDFTNEDEFHDFIFTIMDRSVLFTDVDLEYGDKLLTLSTCFHPFGSRVDTRLGIFARMVRPGESSNVDVSVATHNRSIIRFDEQRRIQGDSWRGRQWDYRRYLLSYQGG